MAELKTDYTEVVSEVAEALTSRLSEDQDGSIVDVFQPGMDDPWQIFLHFGAMEKALCSYRKDKRCKTVYVYVQPEGFVGAPEAITPVRTLLQHIVYQRREDVRAGRLEFGEITFDGDALVYDGNADLKGRHCVLLCDLASIKSPYLQECIALCQEMKATHTVALPMMSWDEEKFAQTFEGRHLEELANKESAKGNKNENNHLS